MSTRSYKINEIFYSLQGEGRLAGTPMVFVRFSQCNLRCSISNAGFDCDTEFESGKQLEAAQILNEARGLCPIPGWVLFTGGEPGLQLDASLIALFKSSGWKLAIETNGTVALPDGIDWICVSPKTAEHTLKQKTAHELKYVRSAGMEIPNPAIQAEHYLISPAFGASGCVSSEDLQWCIDLVKRSPGWALSIQYHKIIQIR